MRHFPVPRGVAASLGFAFRLVIFRWRHGLFGGGLTDTANYRRPRTEASW
jgi:hypothetical protein